MGRKRARADSYDRFAWLYERYWTQTSESFVPIVALLLLPRLASDTRVLDLCCGTGILSQELASSGLCVVGLDGSREMLVRARRNAPGVPLIQADARCFGLTPSFNAATCMFDSLNHMLTVDELRAAFVGVQQCLVPGGWFLFDLNTEAAYLTHWAEQYDLPESDGRVVCFATYDRRSRQGRFILRIQRASGRKPDAGEVVLLQRCHSRYEVLSALESSGLMLAATFGFENGACISAPGPDAERVFYLCRKPA